MSKKQPTIVEAIRDRRLFGSLREFANPESWTAWIVWLKAVFALPLEGGELEIYRQCTGRSEPPESEPSEVYTVVGRRGGKSWICALTAVFISCLKDFKKYLGTGERPHVLVLARDREQAQVVFRYVAGILEAIPPLAATIAVKRADEVELVNGVILKVATSDYRHVRGVTICCAIADEVAFWDSQGVNPDSEIFTALRPAMATIPNAKLLVISTPYGKFGTVYEAHRKYFATDDPRVLVWTADTRTMNPSVPQAFVDAELERDPAAGKSEWLGLFREDIETAFPLETVEACVIPGRIELPPGFKTKHFGFIDTASGVQGGDVTALGIGHASQGRCIVDCIWIARPPFSPSAVIAQAAEVLTRYKVNTVVGDRYAGEWPRDEFRKHRIEYKVCDKNKSELYLNLIPALCSNQVELLDNKKLIEELRRLERRRGKSGKDSIDHPSNGSDDTANSVAGLVHIVGAGRKRLSVVFGRDSYDRNDRSEYGVNERGRRVHDSDFYDCTDDGYTGFARGQRAVDAEVQYLHRHGPHREECSDSPCTKPDKREW